MSCTGMVSWWAAHLIDGFDLIRLRLTLWARRVRSCLCSLRFHSRRKVRRPPQLLYGVILFGSMRGGAGELTVGLEVDEEVEDLAGFEIRKRSVGKVVGEL
jgi:hypothetical protein